MKILLLGDSITAGTLGASYVDRLSELLPDHEIINRGKSGDTVISMYRRLRKMNLKNRTDIAVVFIGVNDVFGKLTLSYRLLKMLRRQRWAPTQEQFERVYRLILSRVTIRAGRVITIPPLLLGENPQNRWNREIEALAGTCRSVSSEFDSVTFLGIRERWIEELRGMTVSDYLPNRMRQIAEDKITLTTDEKIDAVAAERGLHFTVDGAHLNTRGADFIANAICAAVMRPAYNT